MRKAHAAVVEDRPSAAPAGRAVLITHNRRALLEALWRAPRHSLPGMRAWQEEAARLMPKATRPEHMEGSSRRMPSDWVTRRRRGRRQRCSLTGLGRAIIEARIPVRLIGDGPYPGIGTWRPAPEARPAAWDPAVVERARVPAGTLIRSAAEAARLADLGLGRLLDWLAAAHEAMPDNPRSAVWPDLQATIAELEIAISSRWAESAAPQGQADVPRAIAVALLRGEVEDARRLLGNLDNQQLRDVRWAVSRFGPPGARPYVLEELVLLAEARAFGLNEAVSRRDAARAEAERDLVERLDQAFKAVA
jgi:hypothetical protein